MSPHSQDDPGYRRWFRVRGRVQGVGYRMFTQDAANNLGLTGWVRNDSDGSVECEAQGMTPELDQLLDNLQQGPCFSNVEKVEFHEQPIVLGESHFHIRR